VASGEANVGAVMSPYTPQKKVCAKRKLIYIKDEVKQIRCMQLAQR